MAKIRNPISFSTAFNVDPNILEKLGVIDIIINADTLLFIDPLLLPKSQHIFFSKDAYTSYIKYFETAIKLLKNIKSKDENTVAMKALKRAFQFHEISWTCLGYGGSTANGSGWGSELIASLISTAKQIVDIGIDDVDLFMVLALFEEGIGPDRISDMVTNIILEDLIHFNEGIAKELGLPTEVYKMKENSYQLIKNPYQKSSPPILLVPSDIVRDLPIASDWDDISRVVRFNEELRENVNKQVGGIWATMTSRDKAKLKHAALQSKESFEAVLSTIKMIPKEAYDVKNDYNGELFWGKYSKSIAHDYPLNLIQYKKQQLSLNDANSIVEQIVNRFKFLIEDRGLWKELWDETYTKNRKEKAVQRLFFAVADSYCSANELDLIPEAETGNGPVDFKISSGSSKILVEIKLSNNSGVVHGYEKQLEIYKKAEETDYAHYVIVDIGNLGEKAKRVLEIAQTQIEQGKKASNITIIDGMPKESASKRK